jgi:hypothetical protein
MTDDDLTPEQQEVRRLLADARHDAPMPEPVVARLDRVLADLAEEPVREAPVTDLATRRRRATSLLVAAAAVVAVGVGVSQVVNTGTSSQDSTSSADRGAEGAASGAAEDEPGTAMQERQPADGAGDEGSASAPSPAQQDSSRSAQGFATLSRKAYSQDVSALRSQAGPLDELSSTNTSDLDAYAAAGATCLSDSWGEGTFVPVRYDGTPAVLVFRRATGDTQIADLFLCGDDEPRRSVTLPAP